MSMIGWGDDQGTEGVATEACTKVVARGTAARWQVAWHPKALDEKNAIEDVAERVAIAHVIEKLEVDGPALRSPHQSGVMGEEGSGLRELRPRRGRSRWRPIYRRMEEGLFAVLAVGPEAEIDKAGDAYPVRSKRGQAAALESAGATEGETYGSAGKARANLSRSFPSRVGRKLVGILGYGTDGASPA